MSKVFTIQPRQSGKSMLAFWEFRKNPENNLLVVNKAEVKEQFEKKFNFKHKNIITKPQLANIQRSKSKQFKKVILDDYLQMEDGKMYEIFSNDEITYEHLYIFTSPSEVYDKALFHLVTEGKKVGKNVLAILGDYLELREIVSKNDKKLIEGLFYNFITDNDINLQHNFLPFRPENIEYQRLILDESRFNSEVKGEFLKEESKFKEQKPLGVADVNKSTIKILPKNNDSFDVDLMSLISNSQYYFQKIF